MSSSKRKISSDKSAVDEKGKPSVFDRLGPGLSSRAAESEVIFYSQSRNHAAGDVPCVILQKGIAGTDTVCD